MIKPVLAVLLLFVLICINAQTPKYPVVSVPVVRNGIALTNAWAGGFDAPEFSSADLNNDGIKDLFVFDRSGNKVMVFINDGGHSDTAFRYSPQYESLFPPMTLWAVLRDYNHDGIPDIFTYQPGGNTLPDGTVTQTGIEVYKGDIQQQNIHFNLNQYWLNYRYNNYSINMWTNSLGVPAILDVNNDGALDVLDFGVYGSTVVYYENITAQLGLPADSLVFAEQSLCWGNFYVSGTTLVVSLNTSCKTGTVFNQDPEGARHTGATLWPIEYGNDNKVDVLLSGAHVGNMVFLRNTSTDPNANMGWQDTLWPACNAPVNMPLFPAAFQIDGDNDGLNDLLITPNLPYPNPAENFNNVQFYHRIAGDTCGYQYTGNDSFLVHTMLDFGTSSKPIFFDYNNDGLMDLVVGNLFYYNPLVPGVSQLALYRNTGTKTKPQFEEVTSDYMGLSTYNLLNINATFGDLDGDGKPDMIIGDANGDIAFLKNMGDTTAQFPGITEPLYFNINVGANAAPFIYDVNNDGLPDLVIGNQNGTLAWYWNFGTPAHPQFSTDSVNAAFGSINVTLPVSGIGNSQPYIARDSTGNLLLYVGSDQGLVYEYIIDTSRLRAGAFTMVDSNFLQRSAGGLAAMQMYDLNDDGKMDYIVGNSRGGLQLFSESIWDSSVILKPNYLPVPAHVKIYPNPADGQITCATTDSTGAIIQAEVYNLMGQKIILPYSITQNRFTFFTQSLAAGMYVLHVSWGSQSVSAKIIVEHGR
jgi:FG-GAP-like repeat/Secretion system C-terminal sorting domain